MNIGYARVSTSVSVIPTLCTSSNSQPIGITSACGLYMAASGTGQCQFTGSRVLPEDRPQCDTVVEKQPSAEVSDSTRGCKRSVQFAAIRS